MLCDKPLRAPTTTVRHGDGDGGGGGATARTVGSTRMSERESASNRRPRGTTAGCDVAARACDDGVASSFSDFRRRRYRGTASGLHAARKVAVRDFCVNNGPRGFFRTRCADPNKQFISQIIYSVSPARRPST